MSGVIYAFLTGEFVTEESAAEFGDAAERGWVDPSYSMTTLFDSRNDVRPVIKVWEDHPGLPDALYTSADDLAYEVRAALDLLGAYEDNGDGTFYSVDPTVWDYTQDGYYMYALHFTVKRGDTEVSWHPSDAGIEV